MKNKFKVAVLFAGLVGSSAFAQGTVGVHAGLGIPTGSDGVEMGLDFGVSGEFMVSPEFGLGGFFTYQMLGIEGDPEGQSLSYLPYGITANFHMEGLYVGANVGMTVARATVEILGVSVSASDSEFSLGGQLGYDFPLSDAMSLGAEVRYIHILADESSGLLNTNAQLKFMF